MNSARPPPHKRQVAESSLDFLMMQVVTYFLHGPGAAAYLPPVATTAADGSVTHPSPPPQSPADAAAAAAETRRRLEGVGYDVGHRLVERYAVEKERMDSDLEAVKFVCRDFWEGVFKKQVDVLRTNHKGLYVLTDSNFRWLGRVWANDEAAEGEEDGDGPEGGGPLGGRGKVEDYVVFPCGLICGALTRLGVRCRVTAEIAGGAKCSFSVQVIGG